LIKKFPLLTPDDGIDGATTLVTGYKAQKSKNNITPSDQTIRAGFSNNINQAFAVSETDDNNQVLSALMYNGDHFGQDEAGDNITFVNSSDRYTAIQDRWVSMGKTGNWINATPKEMEQLQKELSAKDPDFKDNPLTSTEDEYLDWMTETTQKFINAEKHVPTMTTKEQQDWLRLEQAQEKIDLEYDKFAASQAEIQDYTTLVDNLIPEGNQMGTSQISASIDPKGNKAAFDKLDTNNIENLLQGFNKGGESIDLKIIRHPKNLAYLNQSTTEGAGFYKGLLPGDQVQVIKEGDISETRQTGDVKMLGKLPNESNEDWIRRNSEMLLLLPDDADTGVGKVTSKESLIDIPYNGIRNDFVDALATGLKGAGLQFESYTGSKDDLDKTANELGLNVDKD